jgi:hypothetical protein
LLQGDKAIAASPCSNQVCSISLAKRQMKQDDEEGNVNNLGNYIQLLLSGKKHRTAIKNKNNLLCWRR